MNNIRHYQSNSVISCRDEGADGAILYDPDQDQTMVINPTGRALWYELSSPRTANEMATFLARKYSDVNLEQARLDVEAFLQELLGDFVHEVEAGDSI